MKILVINGSPRMEGSNTIKLTNAFVAGLNDCTENEVETITIARSNIKPCLGCFGCWKRTPGKCVIDDDMEQHIQKYIAADLVIWSFPLYYLGVPSGTKAFMDRLLPTKLPIIEVTSANGNRHPERYDIGNKRHVVISTCGFAATKNNFEPVSVHFGTVFAGGVTNIYCPEGELFRVPQLRFRTDEYLGYVRQAGREYAQSGSFTEETKSRLSELLFPQEEFLAMANSSWGR